MFNGFSVAGQSAPGGRRAVYVVTHVDVFPAGKDQAAALVTALAEPAASCRATYGSTCCKWIGHANHFTLV